MKARDIMTSDVQTIAPEAAVPTIARMLVEKNVSACPVVDRERRVIGIVSEGDLFRRRDLRTDRRKRWWHFLIEDADAMARDYRKSHGQTARDVMTAPVTSITEDTAVAEIADIFDRQRIKRVPVLHGDKLVGIVSRADLVRSLAGRPKPSAASATDAEIAEIVRLRMAAEPWVRPNAIEVVVKAGVVELRGATNSSEQKRSLRVLAEGVPGVRKVKDQLTIEPQVPVYLT